MKVYKYKDYDDYVKHQTETNRRKLGWVYTNPECIKRIVNHFRDNFEGFGPDSIICHGSRNGTEHKYFKKHFPQSKILGTDISDTATQFKNTVQWDFTKENPDWVGKYDIVYSNSIDHSIDPVETLRVWKEQLTPAGIMYIEYSEQQSICSNEDPLDATLKEMISMVENAGFKVEKTSGKRKGHDILLCTQI